MLELAMKLGDWLRVVARPHDEMDLPNLQEGKQA